MLGDGLMLAAPSLTEQLCGARCLADRSTQLGWRIFHEEKNQLVNKLLLAMAASQSRMCFPASDETRSKPGRCVGEVLKTWKEQPKHCRSAGCIRNLRGDTSIGAWSNWKVRGQGDFRIARRHRACPHAGLVTGLLPARNKARASPNPEEHGQGLWRIKETWDEYKSASGQ